jgi:hypothetical protein
LTEGSCDFRKNLPAPFAFFSLSLFDHNAHLEIFHLETGIWRGLKEKIQSGIKTVLLKGKKTSLFPSWEAHRL